MRKDIVMDIDNGDIALRDKPPAYSTSLKWVNEDDFFIYGDCTLEAPATLQNLTGGIGVYVPQKDSLKPIKIKFTTVSGRGDVESTGYLSVNNLKKETITGASMVIVSNDLFFRVYLTPGSEVFTLTSGYLHDLTVDESMIQNEYFLLVSDPSALYQYPLTGVGIRKFLNGNIRRSSLPQKIQSEFTLDGMNVEKIQYNEETDEIITQSTEN